MPGPPPYGRSSTVRCASLVKSRGFHNPTDHNPASSARPLMPLCVTAANISGKSVTTSKRITGFASPVRAPLHLDPPFRQIDLLHHHWHPGKQSGFVPGELRHVVRAVGEHPLHDAEHLALRIHHFQADQIVPV